MADFLKSLQVTDPILTQFALGYANPALQADKIFPSVMVDKMTGKYMEFSPQDMEISDSTRASGADPKEIIHKGYTDADYACIEHALEIKTDWQQEEAAAEVLSLEKTGVETIMAQLLLEREYDTSVIMANSGNFTNKITLTAGDQWSAPSTSDPIGDLRTAIETCRKSVGKPANHLFLPYDTAMKLLDHPDFIARIQYTQTAIVNTDIIGTILSTDNAPLSVHVGAAQYKNAAGTLTDIWTKNAYVYYLPDTPKAMRSRKEPSFGYTFVKKGQPNVVSYLSHPSGLVKGSTAQYSYIPTITMETACYAIYDAIA